MLLLLSQNVFNSTGIQVAAPNPALVSHYYQQMMNKFWGAGGSAAGGGIGNGASLISPPGSDSSSEKSSGGGGGLLTQGKRERSYRRNIAPQCNPRVGRPASLIDRLKRRVNMGSESHFLDEPRRSTPTLITGLDFDILLPEHWPKTRLYFAKNL